MTSNLAERLVPTLVSSSPASRWLQVVSHIDPKYGGLSSAVPALGQRIAEDRSFKISLAAFCAPEERFHPAGFNAQQLSFWPAGRKAWLQDRELRPALLQQLRQVDGVHIHGLWEQSTAITAQAARSLKLPYIISAHGMLEPWALANKRLKKMLYGMLVERKNVARASCLHALTRAEARHFVNFGARSPIAIIPNGVEIPRQKDPSLFLNKFPVLQGKRIVLFLARLHPKKGLDLLIEAWAKVAREHPDAHLVLAGPDSEGTQARIEQYINQHRLQASVSFTGMLRDQMKWSALAAAECFVLPSYSEGLSVSALEAMGMGLPVIVTKPCNMPEVTHYQAGWEIAPEVPALTTALSELLNNSHFENRGIGLRGASLIESRYTWPVVAGQMSEVYRWMQGGPMPLGVDLIFP